MRNGRDVCAVSGSLIGTSINTVSYRYGSVWKRVGQPASKEIEITMAAPTRTPRASWVEEGLRALGVGGPDAVRIEKLAETLGVTKGGFYWHFDGRDALLEEMLDAWERLVIDEVIERVEAGGGDARAKLRRLSALAGSSREFMKIELAIRDWARRDETV